MACRGFALKTLKIIRKDKTEIKICKSQTIDCTLTQQQVHFITEQTKWKTHSQNSPNQGHDTVLDTQRKLFSLR